MAWRFLVMVVLESSSDVYSGIYVASVIGYPDTWLLSWRANCSSLELDSPNSCVVTSSENHICFTRSLIIPNICSCDSPFRDARLDRVTFYANKQCSDKKKRENRRVVVYLFYTEWSVKPVCLIGEGGGGSEGKGERRKLSTHLVA
ncbi:hypothetical protein J6590_046814 [Homalodisca vitripennis]|nr:hypothetical protein J6590_046814 [Homalodisca vitripennis]